MTTIEKYGEVEYTRGRDFFDPSENQHAHVTIVGCGGIGSFTAHALAKLGVPSLALVDFDVVEPHNVPNQLYTMEQVGELKAEALGDTITQTTHATISSHYYQLTEDGWFADEDVLHDAYTPPLHGVVVSALDNMAARAWLWQQVRMQYPVGCFIDGRLGGQNIVVYTANPVDLDDIKGYEATLHSDEEGLEQPCTGRNIIDVGYAMAALITRNVRGYYTGEDVPSIVFQDQENRTLTTSEWLL